MNALWRPEAKSNHALSIRWSSAAMPTRRTLDVALPPTLKATFDARGHTQPAPPPRQLDPGAAWSAHDTCRPLAGYGEWGLAPCGLRHRRQYTDAVITRDGGMRCRWQYPLQDGLVLQPLWPGGDTRRQRPETIRLVPARWLDVHSSRPHTSTRTTVDRPVP